MRNFFVFLLNLLSLSVFAQPRTEEITLFSKMPKNDLKGTLILPAKGSKFNLVVIQPGSGQQTGTATVRWV